MYIWRVYIFVLIFCRGDVVILKNLYKLIYLVCKRIIGMEYDYIINEDGKIIKVNYQISVNDQVQFLNKFFQFERFLYVGLINLLNYVFYVFFY